jgi:hypothetical protein
LTLCIDSAQNSEALDTNIKPLRVTMSVLMSKYKLLVKPYTLTHPTIIRPQYTHRVVAIATQPHNYKKEKIIDIILITNKAPNKNNINNLPPSNQKSPKINLMCDPGLIAR